jgi:adenylate kinase
VEFLVILGPPGSGKGTLSRLLQAEDGWTPLATGEEIRKQMADPSSEFGRLSAPWMDRGDYIPDDLVQRLFIEVVSGFPPRARVVLDGFPRTVPQAEWLMEWLAAAGHLFRGCVVLAVDPALAADRIRGRKVCPLCRRSSPAVAGDPAEERCPCGGPLIPREDDDPVLMARRVARHLEKTAPLREWYAARGCMTELDASRPTASLRLALRQHWLAEGKDQAGKILT